MITIKSGQATELRKLIDEAYETRAEALFCSTPDGVIVDIGAVRDLATDTFSEVTAKGPKYQRVMGLFAEVALDQQEKEAEEAE